MQIELAEGSKAKNEEGSPLNSEFCAAYARGREKLDAIVNSEFSHAYARRRELLTLGLFSILWINTDKIMDISHRCQPLIPVLHLKS